MLKSLNTGRYRAARWHHHIVCTDGNAMGQIRVCQENTGVGNILASDALIA